MARAPKKAAEAGDWESMTLGQLIDAVNAMDEEVRDLKARIREANEVRDRMEQEEIAAQAQERRAEAQSVSPQGAESAEAVGPQ